MEAVSEYTAVIYIRISLLYLFPDSIEVFFSE